MKPARDIRLRSQDEVGATNIQRRKFAYNVRDNLPAEVAVQALRLAGVVVLVRALAPDDFGLLKILLLVSILASLANGAGILDGYLA